MVAPTMPTAIVKAPPSGNWGINAPHPGEIAERDGDDQGADDEFNRAKATALEHQYAVGQHGGDAHAG